MDHTKTLKNCTTHIAHPFLPSPLPLSPPSTSLQLLSSSPPSSPNLFWVRPHQPNAVCPTKFGLTKFNDLRMAWDLPQTDLPRQGPSPPVWHHVTWLAGSTGEAANDVACHCEQSHPPSFPHQGLAYERQDFASLRVGKLPQHLGRSFAPTSSLDGHHKLALDLLLAASLLQHNSVSFAACGWAFPCVVNTPRSVTIDRPLSPSTTRQVPGDNLDTPTVLWCHLHVHVLQDNVLLHTGTCFVRNAGHQTFTGSGPLPRSATPRCREEHGIPGTALQGSEVASVASPARRS